MCDDGAPKEIEERPENGGGDEGGKCRDES